MDIEDRVAAVKRVAIQMALDELKTVQSGWLDMRRENETPERNRHNVDVSEYGGYGGVLLDRLKPEVLRLADLDELISALEEDLEVASDTPGSCEHAR